MSRNAFRYFHQIKRFSVACHSCELMCLRFVRKMRREEKAPKTKLRAVCTFTTDIIYVYWKWRFVNLYHNWWRRARTISFRSIRHWYALIPLACLQMNSHVVIGSKHTARASDKPNHKILLALCSALLNIVRLSGVVFCVRSHAHTIPAFPLLVLVARVHSMLMSNQKIVWGLYGSGELDDNDNDDGGIGNSSSTNISGSGGRAWERKNLYGNDSKWKIKEKTHPILPTDSLAHHSLPVSTSHSHSHTVCVYIYKFIEWLFIRTVWYQSLTRLVGLLHTFARKFRLTLKKIPKQNQCDEKRKDEQFCPCRTLCVRNRRSA